MIQLKPRELKAAMDHGSLAISREPDEHVYKTQNTSVNLGATPEMVLCACLLGISVSQLREVINGSSDKD